MTVGSLFAGIGGFDLGFERAGFEIKWQVEIDPFCRRVLEKHWPHVRRYEDVRDVHDGYPCPNGESFACHSCLEPVDVLCAGFPCQDISSSNKHKKGIHGDRSGLFRHVIRLAGELRPRFIVLENVADLLVRGLGVVLGELATIGYDAEWECLPAAAFGLPQRRWRVFVVAYPDSRRRQVGSQRLEGGPLSRGRLDGDGLVQAEHAAAEAAGRIRGMDAGLPLTVDRVRALGNSVSPVVAQWIAERILEAEGVAP